MVKRVSIYDRSQISARGSGLPSPVGSVTLGRAGNLRSVRQYQPG
jgi:hypothetical protein